MRVLNIADPGFTYDDDDPPPFHAGMFRLGKQLGATQSGMSVYELPPGQSVCPYHYEYGEEEWLLVLTGRPTLRTPEGERELAPFDAAFFPIGPDGAHQIRNDTGDTVRVAMWSTVITPSATAYPDSGKVGVWTGVEGENLMARRSSHVEYYDGEAVG
jgi:uncharacterized cupin superfamily protein